MSSKSIETKNALRQLMKQEKQKKIDSPLAKYTNAGQLMCALCNQQLTSETFWKAHVNGREHKQKLLELKSNIKQTNSDEVFAKPVPPSPVTNQQRGVKRSHETSTVDDQVSASKSSTQHSALPADFFDSAPSKSQIGNSSSVIKASPSTVSATSSSSSSALPEGFFDDPQLDARVRKVEYVNKMEIEWDAFTREVKQETNISEKIEATDDFERDIDRDIKETDELIARWQKIEEMHDIKDNRFKIVKESSKKSGKQSKTPINDDDDDDEEELEKELQDMYNWRQKRS